MTRANASSRCLAALDQDSTLIAVIEISQSSWLVAGMVPGINRQPLKKLAADEVALLQLLYRWREEASKAGRTIDMAEVEGFATERLAGYKRPRSWEFRDELPRTESGKLLKRVLRDEHWKGRQTGV